MRKVERDRLYEKVKAETFTALASEEFAKIASIGKDYKNQVRRFGVLYISKKYPTLRLKEVGYAVGYDSVDSVMKARRRTDVSENYAALLELMKQNGFQL